jgi:hypothetical protein
MSRDVDWLAGCGLLCMALSACGGGGGGDAAFIPQPPIQPPPPGPSVAIFSNPQVGEFASVGASAKVSSVIDPKAAVGPISVADADQPHIRYTSAGTYEIEMPGGAWSQLTLYGQGTDDGAVLNNGNDSGGIFLFTSGSKDHGYKYSELASYMSADTGGIGGFAFGTLTPAGAVPTTGSATFSGTIAGTTDVVGSDPFDGPIREDASGSVTLNFDFGAGSLGGSMNLVLSARDGSTVPIGTFNFTDTVFGVGSTGYSGKFDTAAAGNNFFLGKFTGPQAQETIGAWALPFILDVGSNTVAADHKAHQAFGGWIAKGP